MEGHNYEKLKDHILSLSVATNFNVARSEWVLAAIEISEEWANCPCGKDIKEHCYIGNRLNGNQTYVGNVCINQFIKIDTGTLFDGLKRIAANPEANVNNDLIEHAYRMGYLYSEKEYTFLKDTMKKRKLSPLQLSWKAKINRRIVSQTIVRQRTVR